MSTKINVSSFSSFYSDGNFAALYNSSGLLFLHILHYYSKYSKTVNNKIHLQGVKLVVFFEWQCRNSYKLESKVEMKSQILLYFLLSTNNIIFLLQGGLKAVVWTDAIQGVFTITAVLAIIILGISKVGGIQRVLELNNRGGRLEFFK